MSATILNKRWNDGPSDRAVLPGNRDLFHRFGVKSQERYCPSCDSIVYTRRHKLCGVCGETLPEDCLFTAGEAQNVALLMITERQRHRAWLKKTETN